jgi:hypothetical protein
MPLVAINNTLMMIYVVMAVSSSFAVFGRTTGKAQGRQYKQRYGAGYGSFHNTCVLNRCYEINNRYP